MKLKSLKEYSIVLKDNIGKIFIFFLVYSNIVSVIMIFIYDFTKALEFTLISSFVFILFCYLIIGFIKSKDKEKTSKPNN